MTLPYKVLGSQAQPVIIVGSTTGADPVEISATSPIPTTVSGSVEVANDSGNALSIRDTWAFGTIYATTANQQQVITVPAGKIWQILSIMITYATTATAGNRLVEVLLNDNLGNVVGMIRTGVTQAANLTYNYMLAPGLADLTTVRDTTYVMTPIPPTWIIPAAFNLVIRDNNAVDAAADDFIVRVMYGEKAA